MTSNDKLTHLSDQAERASEALMPEIRDNLRAMVGAVAMEPLPDHLTKLAIALGEALERAQEQKQASEADRLNATPDREQP